MGARVLALVGSSDNGGEEVVMLVLLVLLVLMLGFSTFPSSRGRDGWLMHLGNL